MLRAVRRSSPARARTDSTGSSRTAPHQAAECAAATTDGGKTSMALMTDDERAFGRAVLAVAYANPFLPERIELERQALGADFVPVPPVWHARMAAPDDSANVLALTQRADALAATVRERLAGGARPSSDEVELYQDVVGYLLYYRYLDDLLALVLDGQASTRRVAVYPRFARDLA